MAGTKRRVPQDRAGEESEDEVLDAVLDGILSQEEDESEIISSASEDDLQDEEEDDESLDGAEGELDDDELSLHSDDIPSDGDDVLKELTNGEDSEKDERNFRVTTDANGGVRYEYDEIDPVYDSDDTDAQGPANTIGNIPLSFYDSYPHIGYDINGKKIMRPATGEALDALLDSIEIPRGFTGLTDPTTGKPLELSQDELELLRKVQMNEVPEDGYDPYPDMVEYFTSIEEKMPLSAAPEPKRRFLPSKHEAKRVVKLVQAMRLGKIQPWKPKEGDDEEEEEQYYDVWQDEQPKEPHVMHIPAPKLPPPGIDLSYNPPVRTIDSLQPCLPVC